MQDSAKRLRPGCANAAGRLRQKLFSKSSNKVHQTWLKPLCRALYMHYVMDQCIGLDIARLTVHSVVLGKERVRGP